MCGSGFLVMLQCKTSAVRFGRRSARLIIPSNISQSFRKVPQ
jgi:hypothetical protein